MVFTYWLIQIDLSHKLVYNLITNADTNTEWNDASDKMQANNKQVIATPVVVYYTTSNLLLSMSIIKAMVAAA